MGRLVIGTAGHIDHGKSALVRALTGIEPDRLPEEQVRGMTIELGFAHTVVGDAQLAFVDVPGHERFVRTMLAGAAGIDCVMLTIAADESVMPQTREHFAICCLLGIPAGVIVLTKIDKADAEMRETTRLETRELVAGSFLEDAPVIEVSAHTGEGLDTLRMALADAARHTRERPQTGAARLPIDRRFTMRGFGTVVTGTLMSGRVSIDDPLVLWPSGRSVRIRGLHVHGQSRQSASAGERVALNLNAIEVADIDRGETLAQADSLSVTRQIDVAIHLLASAAPLRHGTRVRVHQGTTDVIARVSLAGADTSVISPGGHATARLRLEASVAVTRADRIIVRAYSPSITMGGGHVLDPMPPRSAIRTAATEARLRRLALRMAVGPGVHNDLEAASVFVEDCGLAGMPLSALVSRAGVSPADVAATVQALVADGCGVLAAGRLVSGAALAAAEARVLAALERFHRAHPSADGLPREEARARMSAGAAPATSDLVLQRLALRGAIVGVERLMLAKHAAAVSDDADAERIAAIYRSAGLTPATVGAASEATGLTPPVVEELVTRLVRCRVLVRVGALVLHAAVLEQLEQEVKGLKSASMAAPTIDVATFKFRYGLSRRLAIPLLEYLDRRRVTRRVGDTRTVL